MHTVNVQHFRVKYRLTRERVGERRRLDQILGGVIGGALSGALARAGVPADAEVCVRRVHVPVRLRLSRADSALSAEWGAALAQAIRRALDRGDAAGVAVFASRTHALLDLAAGVARGDLTRAWAWTQLGLWRAGERAGEREALGEFVRAFADEPARVVPMLTELDAGGLLETLSRRLSVEQLTTLARAALSAHGGTARVEAAGEVSEPFLRRLRADARRVVSSSRLARAVAASRTLARAGEPSSHDAAHALAALAVLEVEPSIFAAGGEAARALVRLVANLLREASDATPPPFFEKGDAEDAGVEGTAFEDVSEDVPSSVETPSRAREAEGPAREAVEELEARKAREARDARQHAFTRFGGLLFLLGLVEDLGLPAEMLYHEALAARSLRWTLQQLALALVPVEPGDAAALAFAGLRPRDDAPAAREDAPTDAEREAVRAFAARLVAGLRERLARAGEAEGAELSRTTDAELLARVCRRRAEIVSDPGWFDVVMSLDEVSTEVRRAGLDLNPGFLSWLGVAVRFVYE